MLLLLSLLLLLNYLNCLLLAEKALADIDTDCDVDVEKDVDWNRALVLYCLWLCWVLQCFRSFSCWLEFRTNGVVVVVVVALEMARSMESSHFLLY